MNLFELFVKIGVDDQASEKLANLSSKIGGGLETAAKIGTAAVGAAAAGIAALTTAAVNNYAEYEQLVGGVDTLFKNASQKVQQYAADAYKNAGMSANEYMANATAFSASLISALGNDTEAAAEYANRAMVSMSDNANKMGTSLDVIVETYQSLSRGNMEMLDNLKLGYGGTKAELERLIQDAASYTDIQEKMGITVDASSMSFDNIVNAIAVVQEKLGIAGATAAEAGTTIEGSINSMKAAWANLLTGLANGNADIEQLVDNLVTTIVGDGTESNLGVLGNVLPAVETALNGASVLVREALPEIMDIIPTVIGDNLPILAEAAVGLVQSLVDGISENQEMLIGTIFDVVEYLVESFVTMLPQIVQLGLELIISLANGIAEALPELIPAVVDAVIAICETITDPNTLNNLVDAALSIILTLADGLMEASPNLLDKLPIIIDNIVNVLSDNLPKITAAGVELLLCLGSGILKSLPELLELVPVLIDSFLKMLKAYYYSISVAGSELLSHFIDGINNKIESVKETAASVMNNIKAVFKEKIAEAIQWGKDLIDNFIGGIKEKAGAIKNAVTDVGQTIKDFIGFSEPEYGPLSDFHTYAPDMMELFAKGIRENERLISDQIADSFDIARMIPGISTDFAITRDSGQQSGYNMFRSSEDRNITINIVTELDGAVLARKMYTYNQNETNRRGASLITA